MATSRLPHKLLILIAATLVLSGPAMLARFGSLPQAQAAAAGRADARDPELVSPGVLIVVAGRMYLNDPLQPNIHHVTNVAYRTFRDHGYTDDDIYYIATDASLDAAGDGRADVDAPALKTNLAFAITQWARYRLHSGQFATVYLMGSSASDVFYLDRPIGEMVAPAEVDGWLDQLEAGIPDVQTTLIVDSCYAGTFLEASTQPTGGERIVVTSASSDGLAFASPSGSAFSDPFLQALAEDGNLGTAYAFARQVVQQAYPVQTPWLDGDGDRSPNEPEDLVIATARWLWSGQLFATPTPRVSPTPSPAPEPTATIPATPRRAWLPLVEQRSDLRVFGE